MLIALKLLAVLLLVLANGFFVAAEFAFVGVRRSRIEALGVVIIPFGIAIFLFEVGLVATLQAFIFATLSAIYLGGAVAEHH